MASSVFIWSILLISCFCLNIVSNAADFFPEMKQSTDRKLHSSISFLAVGDWGRGGNFNQSRVGYQMGVVGKKLAIDFVISTGDNFYNNGLKDVNDPLFRRSFTNIYTAKSLQRPWFVVLGNHDYLGNTGAQLSQALRKLDSRWHCQRNFIVRADIVDIVFIDTNPFVNNYFNRLPKHRFDWKAILPRDQYLSAIRENLDLALKTSRAPWKIVVGHHTIRSIGHHGDTREIVDQILPILEANKVDMYINGHDHCLQHLSNKKGWMHFLTSGGGSKVWKKDIHYELHNDSSMHFFHAGQGFMSVEIKSNEAKIAFYDISGQTLHYFKIKATPKY